jgi:L-alanine-DL-glutamate epimerase-like enolase superfamily enzyme
MKISDVQAFVLDAGKNYADRSETGEWRGPRYFCLLKVITDDGLIGWSDIETQPQVGAAYLDHPSGGVVGFESLRSALLGEDPLERERLWQKMYRYQAYFGRQGAGMHMISGVDIALWDIAGKAFHQPVAKLLGAQYCDRVKAYASTLFRPTPDEMKRAVEGYLGQGFQAIKFGWGPFGSDLQRDLALVKAARDAAGPDVTLMVDAGWYGTTTGDPYRPRSLPDWRWLIPRLEELGIFWLEDFLHPENLAGYAELAQTTRTLRLAAGEQYSGVVEFERLANEGRVHVLQPDLSRCGGLTVAKQIADFALRRQLECVPHAWLTDLLNAASLQLNAYLMHSVFLEYNVSASDLLLRLCPNRPVMKDGFVPVPQGPGLGVEVDEKVIEQYRVA